MDNITEMFY